MEPLLLGVGWSRGEPGVAQGASRAGELLEKGGKSPPTWGAVVYLEGGGADGAARPVTVECDER